jgi:hypothetical protein
VKEQAHMQLFSEEQVPHVLVDRPLAVPRAPRDRGNGEWLQGRAQIRPSCIKLSKQRRETRINHAQSLAASVA